MKAEGTQTGGKGNVPFGPDRINSGRIILDQDLKSRAEHTSGGVKTLIFKEFYTPVQDIIHKGVRIVPAYTINLSRHPASVFAFLPNVVDIRENNRNDTQSLCKIVHFRMSGPDPHLGRSQMFWRYNLLEFHKNIIITPGDSEEWSGKDSFTTVTFRKTIEFIGCK